jgi:hypothetical protein
LIIRVTAQRWKLSDCYGNPKSEGKLTVQLYWLPTNASWLDQIEIWFSLLQRKLLQPNHFSSHQELERAILDFMTHYNQTAKPLKWSYTVEQLEHKLATRLGGGAEPEDERVAYRYFVDKGSGRTVESKRPPLFKLSEQEL